MKRGEVYWVHLHATRGGEVNKSRPAVIISNEAANRHLNRVQVVPLTSRVDRVYPSEALVRIKGKDHKAMADQVMTVSKERLDRCFGTVGSEDMEAIEQALRIQLSLS